MPAPKGIPTPEANAFRLDERIYDSRRTKGWMSNDERLVATHAGGVLVGFEPTTASWDEHTGEMVIRVHPAEARRILRWVRHASEHTGSYSHRLEELDSG